MTETQLHRQFANERSILREINISLKSDVERTPSQIEELQRERRTTVLSMWTLRSAIRETEAAA